MDGMVAREAQPGNAGTPAALLAWNPPHCGDSGMRIAADGTWTHDGAPIVRPAMIRLFSSILRRDADGFVLVTPAEKLSIAVDDAPFLAVEITIAPDAPSAASPCLLLRTNVGEVVAACAAHPLRFEIDGRGGLRPYVLVRHALWARLTRSVSLDLLNCVEERAVDGTLRLGIPSGDAFFPLPLIVD